MANKVTSAGSFHGILHTLSCWSLLWSAACSYILSCWKISHCMVLNCLGDQSQQFNSTGFKINISFSELPWGLFLISSNPLKSNCLKYCTPSFPSLTVPTVSMSSQFLQTYWRRFRISDISAYTHLTLFWSSLTQSSPHIANQATPVQISKSNTRLACY